MSPQTRQKFLAYAAMIFITGAVSGAILGYTGARKRGPMPPPNGKMFSSRFRESLQQEFQLAPDQLQKVDPILERRAKGLDEVFTRSRNEVETIVKTSNEELCHSLNFNADQKQRLEEMGRRRGWRGGGRGPERFEEHERGPGKRGPMPPPGPMGPGPRPDHERFERRSPEAPPQP